MTTPFSPAVLSERAPEIYDRVIQVPGVARLDGGTFGEFSTYLPDGIVRGVQVQGADERLIIAACVEWPHPPQTVAEAIRQSLHGLVSIPIDVHLTDLDLPPVPGSEDDTTHPISG